MLQVSSQVQSDGKSPHSWVVPPLAIMQVEAQIEQPQFERHRRSWATLKWCMRLYLDISEPGENDWVKSIEGRALLYLFVTETIELRESLVW